MHLPQGNYFNSNNYGIGQLEAIKQTKVNMTVWLGNYPIPTDSAPYVRQRNAIVEALQKYGTVHVSGITVGNEYMLKYVIFLSCCEPGAEDRAGRV